MTVLANELCAEKILAANRLYERLHQWKATNSAILALADKFPGFDMDSCTLKVAVIDRLYSTQVYAIADMADHVYEMLRDGIPPLEPAEMVKKLGCSAKANMTHWSFGSKFAHFFICADKYPIYDSYAYASVAHHLGSRNMTRVTTDSPNAYAAFLSDLEHLRCRANITASNHELDAYLWLSGQYRQWRRLQLKNDGQKATTGNGELSAFFAKATGKDADDLAMIL